jgi:glycosyltransferase involved in cell wall biosynthesis
MAYVARRRTLVVYPFMPHYREAIFRALDSSSVVVPTFASDLKGQAGIEPLPVSSVRRHIQLRTVRLGRVTWQAGLMALAIRGEFDAYVFLGDASYLSTWVAAAILRIRRRRVLFWTIGWHAPERGVKKCVRLAYYRLAHHLLLYGNVAKSIGVRAGYPERRMTVIHNSHGIPAAGAASRLDSRPIESSGQPIVGAVIRLNEVKRLDLLILAARELKQRGRPITVVLAGDGPARENLRSMAISQGVDLRLVGAIYSRSDIDAIYAVMQVTVVPAAVGLSAIQSLAHGVPVISDDNAFTQMPEWESIVPGLTGDYFPAGDYRALATVIERWVDRSSDLKLRTAADCKAEVDARWSAKAQLPLIEEAILDESR